jgi:hypothetical protein
MPNLNPGAYTGPPGGGFNAPRRNLDEVTCFKASLLRFLCNQALSLRVAGSAGRGDTTRTNVPIVTCPEIAAVSSVCGGLEVKSKGSGVLLQLHNAQALCIAMGHFTAQQIQVRKR